MDNINHNIIKVGDELLLNHLHDAYKKSITENYSSTELPVMTKGLKRVYKTISKYHEKMYAPHPDRKRNGEEQRQR